MEILNDLIEGERGHNILSKNDFMRLISFLIDINELNFVSFKDNVITLNVDGRLFNVKRV